MSAQVGTRTYSDEATEQKRAEHELKASSSTQGPLGLRVAAISPMFLWSKRLLHPKPES